MEQGGSTWVGVSFLAKTAAAMLFGKGFFITFIFSRIDLIGGSTEVSSEVENTFIRRGIKSKKPSPTLFRIFRNKEIITKKFDSSENGMKMNSSHISFEDGRCIQPVDKSRSVPVYWINLQKSIFRRNYYSYQLDNMGFENQRIKATTRIDSVLLNSLINVVPRVQHTPFELSCVISHLIAIHTAIYDSNPERSGNPYALVTEDDVDFEMDVDLLTLAENAPSGFGSLQLITSNSVYVRELWLSYAKKLRIARSKIGFQPSFPHKFIWTARTHNSPYWSTQAYIINKKVVRPFIDKVVKYDNATAEYSITIVNPSEKDFPCASKKNCMLPYRIVSDLYIFSGCQPAYITNIPIFNGAIVGANSTIHTRKNNDAYHAKAFKEIAKILQDVRKNETLLPDYIRVKKNCIKKRKQNEVL